LGSKRISTSPRGPAGAVVVSEDSDTDIGGVNNVSSLDLVSTGVISDAGATSVDVTGLAELERTALTVGGATINEGGLTFN
jgi:hypothetical protein